MPLEEEDLKQVGDIVSEALKKFGTEKLPGVIKTTLDARLEGVITSEQLDAKLEALKPTDDPPPDNKGKNKNASPEFTQMQARIAQLEAEGKTARERAEAAESARKRDVLRNTTRDALVKAGALRDGIEPALDYLLTNDRVVYNDAGAVVFRAKNEYGAIEETAVNEGAEAFLKTSTGRIFAPPRTVAGTGAHPGGPPGAGSGAPDNAADPLAIAIGALAAGGPIG